LDSTKIVPEKSQHDDASSALSAMPALQMFNIAGHFAGAIAHDFNNILTGVLGNLELMQRRANRLGITDFNDYLAGSRSAAERGVEFSQSLLAIAGHQSLEPGNIEISSWSMNIAALLRTNFAGTIEVESQTSALAANIFCDEAKLTETLLQLGKNAQQSERTRRVSIMANAVMLDDDQAGHYRLSPGRYIEITMQDDGAGMSDVTASRAFEPFFSTKGASGLGLAKTLGFARQSAGHAFIAAHQPGETKITLLLPQAL
jgi:signal transduction histidine kinase